MPSFLSKHRPSFVKSTKKNAEKKRPASASSQKSETHSNSSTATVRPIQHQEPAIELKETPEDTIDIISEEKAIAKKLDELSMNMTKSKSDTGFNNYIVSTNINGIPNSNNNSLQRTESFGDIKTLHSLRSNPSPNPIANSISPRCDSLTRCDRTLALSRNRREATYCKYLLRNAAHRRSSSRLSQKVSNDASLRALTYRDSETPSELTSVTSLSSFGSISSFHSIGSLNSHSTSQDVHVKDALSRVISKDNKNKITQILMLSRRRQLAQDDLKAFTLKDIAICGSRIDRAFLLKETPHYSGVMYPVKLVSTDDLMFPNKKLTIRVSTFVYLLSR